MKTFKTEFRPTAKQRGYFSQAFGVRRWTWNWAVAEFFAQAKKDVFPTAYDLQKQLNNSLVLDPAYSWLNDVNSMFRSEALKDLNLSVKAYAAARHRAKRTEKNLSPEKYKPHFQKKGKCKESCRLMKKGGNEFKVRSAHKFAFVTTQKLKKFTITLKESIAFLKDADIKTCTFSRVSDRYFVSITYEKTNRKPATQSGQVGIDLGIKHMATCYDHNGTVQVFDVPASLHEAEHRTERINKLFSRTQKGSKRHEKMHSRLQRAYLHECNIKKDWRDKVTTNLVKSYKVIKIDDFSFEDARQLDINRSLHRVGCYAFKQSLKQKAAERKCTIVYVPEGTPTTQTCSVCGNRQKLTLSDRTYVCPVCGNTMDRDVNSAVNTYNYC